MVSIVTVNFRETTVTLEFLKSVAAYQGSHEVEVILVDNGCDAPQGDLFKSQYTKLLYICSPENLGFAGGNNLGIASASGEYLLLLNNDTELTAGFIDQMVTEMRQNPSIGLLSPLILYHQEDQLIQYAGYTPVNYFTARNRTIGQFQANTGQFDGISRETAFCHGAAMMCRRSDFQRVGGMAENYFLYYEEMDWCEKFKKAGLKIWFTGNTFIYHKESMSVGKESALKTYFVTRNRFLFIRKNATAFQRCVFYLYYLVFFAPVKTLQGLVGGKSHLTPWLWRGIKWNLREKTSSKNLGFPLPGKDA